jgi:dipeptidyl aminopeptidase/acylaminoacyl peptidase
MRIINGLAFSIWVIFSTQVLAQDKMPLTHDDYDQWESFSRTIISSDGKYVAAEISLQDGDGRVEVYAHDQVSPLRVLHRAEQVRFTPGGKYAVGRIRVQKDTVRQSKLKKTKSSEMPRDSLFILDLTSSQLKKFSEIKAFKLPEEGENWLAMEFEPWVKPQDEGKEREKRETRLKVVALDGSKSYELGKVKSYGFDKRGTRFYFFRENRDSVHRESIWMLNLENGEEELVHDESIQYRQPVFSEDGGHFAFLASGDTMDTKRPQFQLYLQEKPGSLAEPVASSYEEAYAEGYRLSQYMAPKFAKHADRLYFGVTRDYRIYEYEEDSTILEEERVSLDVWGWQDKTLQPRQSKQKDETRKKSFWTVMELETRKILQLHDENYEELELDKEVKLEVGLLTDEQEYKRNYSWNIQIGKDVYVVDLHSGKKTLVEKDLVGYPSLSPSGKFVVWYSQPDSAYHAFEVKTGNKISLTNGLKVAFHNELHDSPSLPGPYGPVHWLENDEALLVYDQYDIWMLDPKGEKAPVNLTKGEGRKQQWVYRVQALNPKSDHLLGSEPLFLSVFGERSKKSGYAKGDWRGKKRPELLMWEDAWLGSLTKADSSDQVIFTRSTFADSPALFASGLDFNVPLRLSVTNPQQEQRLWGTVELVDFRANDGSELQGMLYKPENFDPSQQYPMMVYFYERRSDNLHRYTSPAPSASTINIPYFVSNGYLVFVPDIRYELGLPGPSAFNCIVPGVQEVVSRGFVDLDRIGIQGQSWGGYQVAYLITQTDMFKAAGAGAPVANMTSAYGGIRWESGMSRMFQYEQTQSRIGGTLWEKPMHYLENSPLFYADRINTPVLIMHNDADGAVPWYQGIEFFMALKRNDVPSWMLVYNDEAHNLRKRKNRKDLSIRLSQFFDHYLKDAPAPLWMTEGIPAVEKGRTLKYGLESK